MRGGWIFGLLALVGTLWGSDLSLQEELDQALGEYEKGEQALSPSERRAAFNGAAKLYHGLVERHPSPLLQYNLGNCYFQLGEPAWSCLYYCRALKKLPREERVQHNLAVARQHLGLEESPPSFFSLLGRGGLTLSHQETWGLLFGVLLCTTFFASCCLWMEWGRKGWQLCFATGGVGLLLGGQLFWSAYLSPLQAICVRGASLRQDGGHHYVSVREKPLMAGEKVSVLDVQREGRWVKVQAEEGTIGFVPHEVLQMI